MQISVNNLGPLETAQWSPKNLNVIAGPNGSGKTYLAHAIYSSLKGIADSPIRSIYGTSSIVDDIAHYLAKQRTVELDTQEVINIVKPLIERRSAKSTSALMNYLKMSSDSQEHLSLRIALDEDSVREVFFRTSSKYGYSVLPLKMNSTLEISSANQTATLAITQSEDGKESFEGDGTWEPNVSGVNHLIKGLLERAFTAAAPTPYVLTAERTGISLFQQDIDFGRSRMVEEFRIEGPDALNSVPRATWSPAVEDNFNAFRSLNRAKKQESFIAEHHPAILELFDHMVSGRFVESDGEFKFTPSGTEAPIPMASTSSTVRSLFELGIFLRHIARKGQWLIIDEPELNLHPKNQVLMGRLLGALSNAGLKVLITTHSDYIVRELSILVILSQKDQSELPHGYSAEFSLSPEDVRVDYTVFKGTSHRSELVSAEVNAQEGIAAPFFDETIREQNDHLEEVLWG